MKYLHAMIRVHDIDASLHFYQALLGLKLIRKNDYECGRFSLYLSLIPISDHTRPY